MPIPPSPSITNLLNGSSESIIHYLDLKFETRQTEVLASRLDGGI